MADKNIDEDVDVSEIIFQIIKIFNDDTQILKKNFCRYQNFMRKYRN